MRRAAWYLVPLMAIALAGTACGGGGPGPPEVEPAPAGESGETRAVAGESGEGFAGLAFEEAVRRAEEQGQPWRIAREDGEVFALTDDIVVGRVTFELDGGVVSAAIVEQEEEPPAVSEQTERAELVAAAVERLVTRDNSFGGSDPFDEVEVAEVIGADPSRPLQPLTRELIAVAIEPTARVVFIADADAAIGRLFDKMTQGVAVVSVDDVRIDGNTAETDMRLWCGSLCGVFLTYEATLTERGWEIVGTTGPIAVS